MQFVEIELEGEIYKFRCYNALDFGYDIQLKTEKLTNWEEAQKLCRRITDIPQYLRM